MNIYKLPVLMLFFIAKSAYGMQASPFMNKFDKALAATKSLAEEYERVEFELTKEKEKNAELNSKIVQLHAQLGKKNRKNRKINEAVNTLQNQVIDLQGTLQESSKKMTESERSAMYNENEKKDTKYDYESQSQCLLELIKKRLEITQSSLAHIYMHKDTLSEYPDAVIYVLTQAEAEKITQQRRNKIGYL